MTQSDKRFELQEVLGADPNSALSTYREKNMERVIRAVLWMIMGGAVGALGTALIGATVGLVIWGSGLGFAYDWRDWPIAGAIFGLVVGSIGGTIAGTILALQKGGLTNKGCTLYRLLLSSSVLFRGYCSVFSCSSTQRGWPKHCSLE